jgi:methyltransferase
MAALLVLALAFVPMAFEARLASRHDRALRAAGAVEPRDDVYPWMQVVYPAAFLTMALEAAVRHAQINRVFAVGIAVFVAAKAIKYWAIATLGSRWTFRVLVPPSSSLIQHGPYRYMRHPNYLGVLGELAGLALVARASISGPLSVAVFAGLIASRIRVEERALDRAGST